MSKILNPRETAEILRVAVKTLAQWRWAGRGPRYIKLGNRVRYRLDDVQDFMAKNTHGVPAEVMAAHA